MKILRSIWLIFDINTLTVLVLAVSSTLLCTYMGWTADFPMTLIGIAVVFPIVFSIGGAYKRRENALNHYGTLKAYGRALWYASRDWIDQHNPQDQDKIGNILLELLSNCEKFLHAEREVSHKQEKATYTSFAQLSRHIQNFRKQDLSSGEVSRANSFLSKMIVAFEGMKHIYQYRTPRTLRTYSKLFIYLIPIVYGPYFADIGKDSSLGLTLIMPVLFAVVMVSLDNIQDHLENPFDQVGEDDIKINEEKFKENLYL